MQSCYEVDWGLYGIFVLKPSSLVLPSDYLVDEGAELSSTTELLLDRTHEQALVDLMTPSLVLLINLLQILHVICSVLFLVWLSMQLPYKLLISIVLDVSTSAGNKGTISQQKTSYCSSAVTPRSQVFR